MRQVSLSLEVFGWFANRFSLLWGIFRTLLKICDEGWENTEAATQRCSWETVFWKYAANLRKNTDAKVWFTRQLYWNSIRHGCSTVNLLHIFRTPFPVLLLKIVNGWKRFFIKFHIRMGNGLFIWSRTGGFLSCLFMLIFSTWTK